MEQTPFNMDDYLQRLEAVILKHYETSSAETPGAPLSQFFTLIRKVELAEVEPLVRKTVSLHYGESPYNQEPEFQYSPTMTLDEVSQLGQDVLADLVQDPEGRQFYRINVGVGDNPAEHYFLPGEEDPSFMVFDTDEAYKAVKQPDGQLLFIDSAGLGFFSSRGFF